MDGQNWRPPEKGKSNEFPLQDDETILSRIEIKQEPTIKLEPIEEVNMVTVTSSERATCVSVDNSIVGIQRVGTSDFTNICELAEVKSEAKKEEIDKKAGKDSAEFSANGAIGSPSPKDAKNSRSNKNQRQSKRDQSSFSSKTTKRNVSSAKTKSKASTQSSKKKSTASKGMGKQHKCSSCNYITTYKSHFNRHIRKHTGEKPFTCTHCTKRFTWKSGLQQHMRSHVSEFLFSCSNCLKGFSQSAVKVEHETSCKIRRFECHLCKEYSTFRKSDLVYHMRMQHTGERPFGCDHCAKKFTEYWSLKRHMKTHTGLKPFQCNVCRKSFTIKSNLRRHSKNMHK